MDTRVERVVLETGRHRIVGDLTLPREGYRSRLTDYLNRGDLGFIPLANAAISARRRAGAAERRDFIAVARAHVQLAYPDSATAPSRLSWLGDPVAERGLAVGAQQDHAAARRRAPRAPAPRRRTGRSASAGS